MAHPPSEQFAPDEFDLSQSDTTGHGGGATDAMNGDTRLIVVSNRLPVTVKKLSDGSYRFEESAGGVVSAMERVRQEMSFVWVGWPGDEIDSADQEFIRSRLLQEHDCVPVFLTDDCADKYYNGFCNDILWPLFHYVPLSIVQVDGERRFDFKYWQAYSTANHLFAEVIMQIYRETDIVWVQDYHLMLLPQLLRKRTQRMSVGFFLHTPFPSSEVYRILPVRKQILEGVLHADLIGFHTYEYARHFLSVCTRILGLETTPKGVEYMGRFIDVGIFPIGIDPDKFERELGLPDVQERIGEMRRKFAGKRVLLGVDRLDYIKGVPHKLLAFETLLTRNPEWKGTAVLVQIAIPSRTGVEEYKKLASETHELVGRINGFFGSVDYIPIVFINQSVNFQDLCALYSVADVCVVTSIRDGMNLVSYEYVMCQVENHGVLVLSEFAGSAQSLSGAIRVNPWNIEEVASGLHEALSKNDMDRGLKHWKLYRYVKRYTAQNWSHSFVSELRNRKQRVDYSFASTPPLRVDIDILPWMKEGHRVILLNYEGTLAHPRALVDRLAPGETLHRAVAQMAMEPLNQIYIFSGRSKTALESWFGDCRVGLVAEHGTDYRAPGETEWRELLGFRDGSWRHEVIPILQYFTERTPGSYLEEKDKVITWHYFDSDPQFGSWQSKELLAHLAEACASLPIEVMSGYKIVEVRPVGLSRVSVVQRILKDHQGKDISFILAVGGSEKSDEDLYTFLENESELANVMNWNPTERSVVPAEQGGVTSQGNSSVPETTSLGFGSNATVGVPTVVKALSCRVGKARNSAANRYIRDCDRAVQVLRELASTVSINIKRVRAPIRTNPRSVSTEDISALRNQSR
uniref:alpha,alpha-trehalose-phosphate synthase (UDP-forming) n=1 Tax=Compsopogon caeruleus TaxID=31354 RepID=A0A7S1XCI7_9RHOD